jgi:hypothetical protein
VNRWAGLSAMALQIRGLILLTHLLSHPRSMPRCYEQVEDVAAVIEDVVLRQYARRMCLSLVCGCWCRPRHKLLSTRGRVWVEARGKALSRDLGMQR